MSDQAYQLLVQLQQLSAADRSEIAYQLMMSIDDEEESTPESQTDWEHTIASEIPLILREDGLS